MVLPIIVGIGVTLIALTTKSTISAIQKFKFLTPVMIASLNNIRIENDFTTTSSHLMKNGKLHPDHEMHSFIRSNFANAGFDDIMTETEALKIMGIDANEILKLDKKILKDRYRKLMIMNHPDKNGSQYLTQKINQAKDILDKSYMFKK